MIAALRPLAFLLIASLVPALCAPAQAQPVEVTVYLFWQRGCPHCERAIEYLLELEARTPHVEVLYLELRSSENRADDLAIFAGAMLTLEASGAAARYAHHAQLVGGVALLAVGALLVLRPEWLLFG